MLALPGSVGARPSAARRTLLTVGSTQGPASWLPDHQLHLAATLAHTDATLQRLGEVLHDYLRPPGPLRLANVADGNLCHVTVTGIAPLPAAVAHFAADAMTQMRASIEHTLYAEVEADLGRQLTAEEARRIEMPATTTAKDFTRWLSQRKRSELPPLREGSPLVQRIRSLQPYQRLKDMDGHPLRVLAEHTNLAKHRTPAVATVRLAQVNTWPPGDHDIIVGTSGAPLAAGSVLATGPLHKQMPLDIWPMVAIRRPHSAEWKVLMKEMGTLEDWVRTVAIPVIVTGTSNIAPLPPQMDTTTGWDDVRDAINAAGTLPAAQRSLNRIIAHGGRENLVETLALHPEAPEASVIEQWLAGLTDDEVIEQLNVLASASKQGPWASVAACGDMIRQAVRADLDRGTADVRDVGMNLGKTDRPR